MQLTNVEYGKLCLLALSDQLFVNDNLIVIPNEPSEGRLSIIFYLNHKSNKTSATPKLHFLNPQIIFSQVVFIAKNDLFFLLFY